VTVFDRERERQLVGMGQFCRRGAELRMSRVDVIVPQGRMRNATSDQRLLAKLECKRGMQKGDAEGVA
jgi:hypothetical protein